MHDMLFGESARALVISFTSFSQRVDWWTSNIVLYEYGTSSQVMQSIVRSYPFKPNFFETDFEKDI
jgi:hypothetical protein